MQSRKFTYLLCSISALIPGIAEASPFGVPVREYGGAVLTNERSWSGAISYPQIALRNEVQGRVIVAFIIKADGNLGNCTVDTSSGSTLLDEVPCKVLMHRARFKPLTQADGTPVETKGRYSVDFWIPD